MDYEKIYASLMERAKGRTLRGYSEKHHITPKCMGGKDDIGNLVRLTPEEHYLAHQLLVRMYPQHTGLVFAAIKMTMHSENAPKERRSNNKLYGWLKRRQSKIAKERKGEKNGSYGSKWFYNPETLENIKCGYGDIPPKGFIPGRKFKKNSKCKICNKDTGKVDRVYCLDHKPKKAKKAEKPKKRKSEKPKNGNKSALKQEQTKNYYLKLYDKFIEGRYTSIRQFKELNNIDKSIQAISSSWKKFVKGYTCDQGKNGNKMKKFEIERDKKYLPLFEKFKDGKTPLREFAKQHNIAHQTLWKHFKRYQL